MGFLGGRIRRLNRVSGLRGILGGRSRKLIKMGLVGCVGFLDCMGLSECVDFIEMREKCDS